MADYQMPTSFTTPFSAKIAHLRDSASNISGDESILPASTLSMRSDFDSSSDMTSLLMTARSTSPTSFLGESGFHQSLGHDDPGETVDFEKWMEHDNTDFTPRRTNNTSRVNPDKQDTPTTFCLDQDNGRLTPIHGVISPRSRTPSPGMSKMLLSLSDHPVERPCSPSASTLYKNTKTHRNPSELGKQTYDECMMFTRWANTFLQHSLDQFLITDLARDLGDGITLLSLVEMLVGEYPPQIHIKPALDVQKMENIQTCLDFLEHYGVSVNGITADDIVKGNLKVVLALCCSLQRHFGSNADGNRQVHHLRDRDDLDLSLFSWVSKVTGKQVVDFQSFQDGTVLCLLLNKILEGVIPNLVLEFGSPAEKISLALKVSSEELSIGTGLQADAIINQRCREKFVEYLRSLYQVYSSKSKKVHDGFEQRNLRRELKRQLLREQRVNSERRGSDLTYLGELNENKSRTARETLQVSLASASKVVPNGEALNGTRLQVDELEHVSLTNDSEKTSTPRSGTLNSTKQQLDELQKELELLKLACSDSRDENNVGNFSRPDSLFKDNSNPNFKVPGARGKPANARLELRDLYRGSTNANVSDKNRKIVDNTESSVAGKEKVSRTESIDVKPLFSGCYLGEIPNCFDKSRRRELDEPSFAFKELDVQPLSSIREETRTFLPHDSPQSLFYSKSDALNDSGQSTHVKPYSLETKGISNLFEVDFDDADVKKNRDRENLALRRMFRAGNQSKLEGSRSRHDLDSVYSTNQEKLNSNSEAKKTVMRSPTFEGKRKQFDKPLGVLSSRKPLQKEGKLIGGEKPFNLAKAFTEDSTGQHKELQRSPSKETRHREQVLAKKSVRNVQPSPTKTHHALTALIRMSAKNAGAMYSEEAQ